MRAFRIDVPESELFELRQRLHRTRWPEQATTGGWEQGIPLDYTQELCAYWADRYDWRRCESELNALPQFRTGLDGGGDDTVDVHLIHVRSPHAGALPLLLTHGWPGSVVEFLDVVTALTDPPDPADAFHVVAPSLPGYGFSGKPTGTGWGVERIAVAWAQLMDRLGYERYGAQGGDWGSMVTAALGTGAPENLVGVHLTMPLAPRPPDDAAVRALTRAEQDALAARKAFLQRGSGYAGEQSTRPQTLGYGLADSPAAQCAWIVEKFWDWTDCAGHPENVISRDRLLDNVMHYWLPGNGASSARLYWESYRSRRLDTVTVPSGVTIFPREIVRLPRQWIERRFTDLRYWSEPETGGHFPSLEQPEVFVDELRAFFRLVRAGLVERQHRRGEAVQVVAPADRPDLARGEEPGHAGGAEHVTDHADVVVGLGEHRRAPAVAGEQQRPARRSAGAAQQLGEVLPCACGVAHLEPHGLPDLHRVPHRDGSGVVVHPEYTADQEVAASVLVGVLVDRDADVQAAARKLLLLGGQRQDDLRQPGVRGGAGELVEDVAARPG